MPVVQIDAQVLTKVGQPMFDVQIGCRVVQWDLQWLLYKFTVLRLSDRINKA
jgi:hypothetical protein